MSEYVIARLVDAYYLWPDAVTITMFWLSTIYTACYCIRKGLSWRKSANLDIKVLKGAKQVQIILA